MQCRYHVGQLGRLYPQFQSAGAEILVILGGKSEQAKAYAESLHTPFPVLADPDREVYEKFGLEKAMFVIQRTASVIVDRHGIVRYIRRVTNPMAWLQESKELIETAKTLG
jgi:thioredoxin-dependent peroxiredoxin